MGQRKRSIRKGHWECRQHGKECDAYKIGWAKDYNERGIVPERVPEQEKEGVAIALEWVVE